MASRTRTAARAGEELTDAVIAAVAAGDSPAVFLLWGKPAEKKAGAIDSPHTILKSPHPSPLSARRGFFGSRPFSQANAALRAAGRGEVEW